MRDRWCGGATSPPWSLGSFLWTLATGCTAFFAGFLAVDVFGWEGVDVAFTAGVASAAVAASLWAWRPAPLRHVATLAALAVSVGVAVGQVEHVGGRLVGVALWALGVAWGVLAWAGRVRAVPLGYAVGGVLTIVAGQVLAGDQLGFGEDLLAVATAVASPPWSAANSATRPRHRSPCSSPGWS